MYSDYLIVMKNGKVVVKGVLGELLIMELIVEIYGVVVKVLNDVNIGKYIVF